MLMTDGSFDDSTITTTTRTALGDPPKLNFGDINVVVLTDIHSWVGGHRRQESQYDADLGDVLSFYERVQDYCDDHLIDIFLVNNGDFVHGTGLSQMNPSDPSHLIPLLEKMPYDAITCGNHELYDETTIDSMIRPGGYVDWWGDRYLTANIMRTYPVKDPKQPLGHRYKVLEGKHQNTKLLTFGFLYNMHDAFPGLIHVDDVKHVIQQDWFIDALMEERYDAILILAHMDLVNPLVDVIRTAIRHQIGDGTPIVFITGHTHYRGFKHLDDLAVSFEAGRYLDTVGFVSFPKRESVRGGTNTSNLFQHEFMDASREVLFHDVLGYASSSMDDAVTTNGKALSTFIDITRKELGLEEEIGCAPQSYILERSLNEADSLWRLYRDEVIPKMFPHIGDILTEGEGANDSGNIDRPLAMVLSKESWRYDVYDNSTLVVDDINAVAPFNDTVVYMGTFPGSIILKVCAELNKHLDHQWMSMLPNYILIGDIVIDWNYTTTKISVTQEQLDNDDTRYHLYTHQFQDTKIQKILQGLVPDDVNVTITKTEYRSTMIWMAFVKEYWPCDGHVGQLPDWFPSSPTQYFFHKNNTADNRKKVVAIVMAVIMTSFVIACGLCFYVILVRYVCSYQPIMQGDDVTFYRNGANNVEQVVDDDIYKVPSSSSSCDSDEGLKGGYNIEKSELDEDDGIVII